MYVTEDGSSSGRTFFKQHRDILLENLEPMNFCKPEIASLFDNDDMIKLNKTEGRRKKAERLLEMCDKLPKDKVEIIRSYFVQYISPPKTVTCNEEIGMVSFTSIFEIFIAIHFIYVY